MKVTVLSPSREIHANYLPHSNTVELYAKLCLGPCSAAQALAQLLRISAESQCRWAWNMISGQKIKSDFDKSF